MVTPHTQYNNRYITMMLDENDRSTTTRLMKVKDMLLAEAQEERRAANDKAIEAFSKKQDQV